jgi:hypothetical protein
MTEEATQAMLSNRSDVGAMLTKAKRMRAKVAKRPAGIDQSTLLTADLPPEMAPYVTALRGGPHGPMFTQGWEVRMVDLEAVVAMQPCVFLDGKDRVGAVDPGDIVSIAKVTMPELSNEAVEPTMDGNGTYSFVSDNPNLRVLGPAASAPQGATPATFGYGVGVPASVMQVARYRDRYVMRDGYHRAVGLMQRGIVQVPAFVWDNAVVEVPMPPNMLAQQAVMGDRPPFLRDYLNDHVALVVGFPAMRKAIFIHAIETLVKV